MKSNVCDCADRGPEEFEESFDALVEGVPTPANTLPSGWMAFELDHSTAVPSALSAGELVDAVTGYDRVVAWATARQQELIAEFHRRPDNGVARPMRPASATVREWAGDEIALALTPGPRCRRGSGGFGRPAGRGAAPDPGPAAGGTDQP